MGAVFLTSVKVKMNLEHSAGWKFCRSARVHLPSRWTQSSPRILQEAATLYTARVAPTLPVRVSL